MELPVVHQLPLPIQKLNLGLQAQLQVHPQTEHLGANGFQKIVLNSTAFLRFCPEFLDDDSQFLLLKQLAESIDWQQEYVKLFGKTHAQPRLTAWFGRGFSAESRYTKSIEAHSWTGNLERLRASISRMLQVEFDSCLLNYYRNGDDCMGMHSDDEECLGSNPVIASLSLGCGRDFVLQAKSLKSDKTKIHLPGGSLLVMEGTCQRDYKHGIPRRRNIQSPRINLTFRKIVI